MAIKISNTTVINDSRGLENITNLKTVNGSSILGSGDISISGTFVPLGTYTPNGASTVDITGFTTTYDVYAIQIVNLTLSGTTTLNLRVSTDNVNFNSGSSDYRWHRFTAQSVGTNSNQSTAATSILIATTSSNNLGTLSGWIYVYQPANSSVTTSIFGQLADAIAPGGGLIILSDGRRETAQADTAVRLFPGAGTCTGTVRLYGIKNS